MTDTVTAGTVYPPLGNGFVGAIFSAYSDHYKLVIRPDDVWLAGENGLVLRSATRGHTWDLKHGLKSSGRETLTGVWGTGYDDVYVVGHLEVGGGGTYLGIEAAA